MTDVNGRPIVAELGRAETPEETRIRKETNRRLHRQHQTTLNLVLSLVASLGVVLFLVAVVVRPGASDSDRASVDYRAVAKGASSEVGSATTIAAPTLPGTYSSNRADYQAKTADGVPVWTVGLITPDQQYIGLHQGIRANTTWVSNQLAQHTATGTRMVDGARWTVYDRRDEGTGAGNLEYGMVATFGRSTIVLAGTADAASFTQVARAVTDQQQGQ